jgi:hypothetical protein
MESDQEHGFSIELYDDDVRTLYYAICEAIRVWPGSPARPVEEQEHLWDLRQNFYRMILEMSYEATAKRNEDESPS